MADKQIELALADCTAELMAKPGVFGTAQGVHEGADCIIVYVDNVDDVIESLSHELPDKIDGYPVCIKVSGKIRALSSQGKN